MRLRFSLRVVLIGIAVVALAMAIASPWIKQRFFPEPQRLRVRVEPVDTAVFINGVEAGRSPLWVSMPAAFFELDTVSMQSWEISLFAINNERTALLLNDGTGQVMELSFLVQSKDRSKYVTVETPHGLRSQIGEIGIGYGPPHPTREVYAEMQPK